MSDDGGRNIHNWFNSNTSILYEFSEVATKILPNLFPLTVDPDKSVRDPAFKTIKGFMTKLERVSDDPTLKEQFGKKCNFDETFDGPV